MQRQCDRTLGAGGVRWPGRSRDRVDRDGGVVRTADGMNSSVVMLGHNLPRLTRRPGCWDTAARASVWLPQRHSNHDHGV